MKASPDPLQATHDHVQEAAREAFLAQGIALDQLRADATLGRINMLFPVYVLGVLAELPLELKKRWAIYYFVARQRRIPLYGLYRRNHHTMWVSVAAALSGVVLFSFGAAEIFDMSPFKSLAVEFFGFVLCLISAMIVVAMSAGSGLQSEARLLAACSELTRMAEERRERHAKKSRDEAVRYAKKDQGHGEGGPA